MVGAGMNPSFDYDAPRARKARFANGIHSPVVYGIDILILLLLAACAGFILYGYSIGYAVAGIAMLPLMFNLWYKGDLRHISTETNDSIAAKLESGVLGRLSRTPTPKELARAATSVTSGQFFAARFGLAANFLIDMSSDKVEDTEAVWVRAKQIADNSESAALDGACLVAALVETQPNLVSLLPHLQLDEKDLVVGVGWFARLNTLIADQKKPKRTGGVARDWSFGYTPLLSRFGINISDQIARGGLLHVRLDSHSSALGYLLDTFSSNARQNVALVGALGSGKTSIVHAFAELLLDAKSNLPNSLKFRQVISLDPSALISAASTRSELENLVNQLLLEAYRAKNIIICLDDAQLFLEDTPGSVNLSSILLPILEGGQLRLILTMDEQRWLQIAQRSPALVSALNRVAVPPASEEESIKVMQDQLISTEFKRKVTYMYQSLKEAYRLSERYVYDQAQPGKAVRLLESAAAYAEQGAVTAHSVQRTIEIGRAHV